MKVCTRSSSLLVSAAVLALAATQSSVDAALDYNVKLYGINYDRRQGPDWDPKQCKNSDQVWSDMRMISEISNSVRIYGLDERGDPNSRDSCHTAHVLRAAKQYGMKVALGVWPGNNMPNELRKLENLLKAGLIDGNVMGLHVGSEAVYRKDYSADVAITYLNQARELLKRYGKTDLKLTIADVVDSYYQNPQLLQAVDYVSINQFSLWEKKDAREGMAIMLDRIRSIRMQAAKLGKEVVISETGWSSDGKDDRTGITSTENQKKYFEDFYHQATAHGLPYYWFAAIDLGWIVDQKVPDTSPVEAYFGVFDKYNNKKASFTNLNLKPRARTTFQLAANGRFLAETFDANKIEEVAGVETIAESNDKFTNLRYQWFFDQEKGMIRSLNSDRCLDAYQAWDGGIVHTYMCVDSERNQKWNYDASTKQIKHASHAGFCLDSAADGKLSLWSCSDSNANQEWVVSGVAVVESNAVRFFAKESTNFAQLVRVGENVAVGTGAAGAAGSEWIYDEATKLVKSKGSDYCLDAYEGWSGGRVHVWTCNAQEKNQQWTFDSGSGQLKHAKHTGFCLDRDPNGANGAGLLQLWGCHTNNFNQVWRKVSASAKAVRITGSDSSVVEFFSRDKLQLTPSGKRDSQTWFYNALGNTLLSKWGGECLDADQPYDNSLVHTWDCIPTEGNQKWKFENGLIKHQKHTGFCLAFKNAADKVLVLKTCSASDATQSFTLPAATA